MKKEIALANKILSRIYMLNLLTVNKKRYCGDTNEIVAVVFTLNSLENFESCYENMFNKVKKVTALPAITCSKSPIKNKM